MEKQWQSLFLRAPKSLQMVTAAMKLKDPSLSNPSRCSRARWLTKCQKRAGPAGQSSVFCPLDFQRTLGCLEEPRRLLDFSAEVWSGKGLEPKGLRGSQAPRRAVCGTRAGRFFTTEPPGKLHILPSLRSFKKCCSWCLAPSGSE